MQKGSIILGTSTCRLERRILKHCQHGSLLSTYGGCRGIAKSFDAFRVMSGTSQCNAICMYRAQALDKGRREITCRLRWNI